jgi:hypothetical protein
MCDDDAPLYTEETCTAAVADTKEADTEEADNEASVGGGNDVGCSLD